VTARDGAPDYRLATATVTVKVIDVEDEVPVFHQSSYEARVKENMPDYNVIQVTVSQSRVKPAITRLEKRVIRNVHGLICQLICQLTIDNFYTSICNENLYDEKM